MGSGSGHGNLRRPSGQRPTDRPPLRRNSLGGRGSGVEEKPLEEKGKTSSRFTETASTQRGEAGSCSSQGSSGKRKRGSRDSPCARAEPSPGEERSAVWGKRAKSPDAGPRSCSQETGRPCPSRTQRERPGHRKQPRSRPSGGQPPLLRTSLVTSLRTLSEATHGNIVQMQHQQAPAPLSWEHYALLAELRGHLHAQMQTVYAMATQAAYVFPAEAWLSPAPPPGPSGPEGDGEEKPRALPGRAPWEPGHSPVGEIDNV
ncbi:PREDICTED: protein FRG2-like [Myotis davidii]|uniref:protein FRG2-like n=1 Tax=Myotis davidii TaxID=225400 RepID=UPI0003EC2CAA|nr:PREDICTED: protein FRG2-like [Myotis davidii]